MYFINTWCFQSRWQVHKFVRLILLGRLFVFVCIFTFYMRGCLLHAVLPTVVVQKYCVDYWCKTRNLSYFLQIERCVLLIMCTSCTTKRCYFCYAKVKPGCIPLSFPSFLPLPSFLLPFLTFPSSPLPTLPLPFEVGPILRLGAWGRLGYGAEPRLQKHGIFGAQKASGGKQGFRFILFFFFWISCCFYSTDFHLAD